MKTTHKISSLLLLGLTLSGLAQAQSEFYEPYFMSRITSVRDVQGGKEAVFQNPVQSGNYRIGYKTDDAFRGLCVQVLLNDPNNYMFFHHSSEQARGAYPITKLEGCEAWAFLINSPADLSGRHEISQREIRLNYLSYATVYPGVATLMQRP